MMARDINVPISQSCIMRLPQEPEVRSIPPNHRIWVLDLVLRNKSNFIKSSGS